MYLSIRGASVRPLDHNKRAWQVPVLDDLLAMGLKNTDKIHVCSVCQNEGRNMRCSFCFLGQQ